MVTAQAFPEMQVLPYLMLVDKSQVASSEGLNQKFKLTTNDGRKGVEIDEEITEEDLRNRLLIDLPARL